LTGCGGYDDRNQSRSSGAPRQFVVAGNNTIYGVNYQGVWEWSGSGTLWWRIGNWAPNIVAAS
jgi:hypothetical protein